MVIRLLALCGAIILSGCTHCPVKEVCHMQLMPMIIGKMIMMMPINICQCPVDEVPNE